MLIIPKMLMSTASASSTYRNKRKSLMSWSSRSIHSSRVSTCASGKPATASSSCALLASDGSPATFAHVQRFCGRS